MVGMSPLGTPHIKKNVKMDDKGQLQNFCRCKFKIAATDQLEKMHYPSTLCDHEMSTGHYFIHYLGRSMTKLLICQDWFP